MKDQNSFLFFCTQRIGANLLDSCTLKMQEWFQVEVQIYKLAFQTFVNYHTLKKWGSSVTNRHMIQTFESFISSLMFRENEDRDRAQDRAKERNTAGKSAQHWYMCSASAKFIVDKNRPETSENRWSKVLFHCHYYMLKNFGLYLHFTSSNLYQVRVVRILNRVLRNNQTEGKKSLEFH